MLPMTEQVISAVPDVRAKVLNAENGDFIVLGCDGIWDSLSSQSSVLYQISSIIPVSNYHQFVKK